MIEFLITGQQNVITHLSALESCMHCLEKHVCNFSLLPYPSDLDRNIAKNCQYLKDDHIHFKIIVNAESSSSTPWLI